MDIKTYSGEDFSPLIPDISRLRITVFREFPYLYDGDVAYEMQYLRHYIDSPKSVVIVARDGDVVVGASTGLPLNDADGAFQDAFQNADIDPQRVFYFGESVLAKAYRKQGVGGRFFDLREAHARNGGFEICAFCAVERHADPRQPADYRPLHGFWQRRGYTHRPDLTASFRWKEVGDAHETDHIMSFWLKTLEPA
ncbi:MAG: GNAT family N-acetyltransferase [bacterium]